MVYSFLSEEGIHLIPEHFANCFVICCECNFAYVNIFVKVQIIYTIMWVFSFIISHFSVYS